MTNCDNADVVNIVKNILKHAKNPEVSSIVPISKTEIRNIERALNIYLKDCTICKTKGYNDYKCHNAAQQKLMRAMPFMRKNIYPWRNYDWDYGNFIDNNYSVLATGASKSGSFTALFKNIKAFIKLTGGYLSDPNPSDSSYPGKKSRDGDIPYYDCDGTIADTKGNKISDPMMAMACNATVDVKYRNKERPPTTDKFLKTFKLTGDKSSSYFVKVGTCPRKDISQQKKCESRGYDWVPNPLDKVMKAMPKMLRTETKSGSCHQPRYMFVNNTPGMKIGPIKARGLIPALANDFMSLSPDKIFAALQGQSITNYMTIQSCPKVKERFTNYRSIPHWKIINQKCIAYMIIFSILVIIFILYKFNF
jgi:hypothetical protein